MREATHSIAEIINVGVLFGRKRFDVQNHLQTGLAGNRPGIEPQSIMAGLGSRRVQIRCIVDDSIDHRVEPPIGRAACTWMRYVR